MVCIGADAKLCGTRDENNIINVDFKKNGRLWADTVKKILKFTTIHLKICFRLAVVNLQQNVVSFSTSP